MSFQSIACFCCIALSATFTLGQENTSPKQGSESLTGTWHCQFDSPFGLQTYHLHIAINDAGDATAHAEVDTRDEERKVEFVDVRVDNDSISFA